MNTFLNVYQNSGLKKLLNYKPDFAPNNLTWLNESTNNQATDPFHYNNVIDNFISAFCEYQLADNNYMTIHMEANQYKRNDNLFDTLSLDKILKHLTYIIWTDKLVDGYFPARVKDQTIYQLLSRLEKLEH